MSGQSDNPNRALRNRGAFMRIAATMRESGEHPVYARYVPVPVRGNAAEVRRRIQRFLRSNDVCN